MAQNGRERDEAYFASVAESYDRLQPVVVGPAYEAGLTMMLDLIPYDSDAPFQFVELGCGTATLACSVLERFPRCQGVAIDGESAMLDIARRKLASYGQRAEVRQADMSDCDLPNCDVVLCAYAFHHVSPETMPELLQRISLALRPGGCLLLLDHMLAGPTWGQRVGRQGRRIHQRHVAAAIAAGRTTQQEIDDRWEFKRRMKADGKDVEFRHSAEKLVDAMREAGFNEVGLVWRLFANAILVGFVPATKATSSNG